MGSPSDTTHVVPTHQRITSSKQWVLDHRREPTGRHAGGGSRAAGTPAAPAADRETKRRLKELETARLQLEYDSVKQENDKLKKVIVRLKQEIQVYSGLLASEQPQRQQPLDELLISKSKRRKKSLEPGPGQDPEAAVTSDDILLMNTLTDVLAQMQQP
ncbi:hypothetical protein HG536_0A03540 [Torulaspora globosa]|uniref:Uncharacterized protein n=1 Tax=Torulaspora globosa TaxID=48254 RepID=A0A7G3ZAK0_9SACH|nr:uncharacterized protein HG536_0A03540 [Torulaspora globosa]QLL30536.1 hypothetical protein HG536_0A03540 [Torulaspora globosa]